jgi:hypothetical protein
MSGGPTGINATALRQWLQTWLKPWAFSDIEFGDIAGAQTNDNGDLVVPVTTDGITIVGDGTPADPISLVVPVTIADGGTDSTIGKGLLLQVGQAAVNFGDWSVDVVLAPAQAHTIIVALPSWNTTVYFTNDTDAGFTLNFGTSGPPDGGIVMWGVSP